MTAATDKNSAEEPSPSDPPSDQARELISGLVAQAFGPDRCRITSYTDVNRGRGAFSIVVRADLVDDSGHIGDDQPVPATVVAKLPIDGPNGAAAVAGGVYAREALAYRHIVPNSSVRTPYLHAVQEPGDGTCLLLLEDLGPYRAVDQLDGLTPGDALEVAAGLRSLHRQWRDPARLTGLQVRRNTISALTPEGLHAGLDALGRRWEGQLTSGQRETFAAVVSATQGLVDRFESAPPTLCHGDPRADNMVFDGAVVDGPEDVSGDRVVLFDWQQVAVQFGEADLAWLAATSLNPADRRVLDRQLVEVYDGDHDRYRLGFALPGLAVLMLAQRHFPTERARRFVALSLQRIATALEDLDVAALARVR